MMGIESNIIWVTEVTFSTMKFQRKRVFPFLEIGTLYMSRFVSDTDYFALTFGNRINNETESGLTTSSLNSPLF